MVEDPGLPDLPRDRVQDPGMAVLVVDPDATHRLLTSRLLDRFGVQARVAANVTDTLGAASHAAYRVVLVDAEFVGQLPAGFFGGLPGAPGVSRPLLVAMGSAVADGGASEAPGFDLVVGKPVSPADVRLALGLAARDGIPRARPRGSEPVLDGVALRRLADDLGDPEIVHDTVRLYLDELPGRLDLMRNSLAGRNATALRAVAHSLKSASAMLGAAALARSCLDLEREAAAGQLPGGLVDSVVDQARPATTVLRAYLAAG